MNLLLASLAGINLIMLLILQLLNFSKVTSKQQILFIKIGLLTTIIIPIVFYISILFPVDVISITLPSHFINQAPALSLSNKLFSHQFNLQKYIFIFYAIGFIFMLSRIILSYINARKKLRCSISTTIQGHQVYLNNNIESPISFGFPIAKIYFPEDIEENLTSREIQMCLAHEKIHLSRNDSFWKFLSLIVQAILFFAPWPYWIHKKLMLQMEILCDELTCAHTKANISEYGNLLLAITSRQSNNLIFTNMTDSTIKKRFLAMKSKSIKRPYLILCSIITLLLAGSAAVAMSTNIMKEKTIYKISTKIVVDGKIVSSPRIVLFANQKALIVLTNTDNAHYQGLRMGLLAKSVGIKKIGINFDIQYKNGNEQFHTKPYVVTNLDQESKITISDGAKHSYQMYVLAALGT